jgi:hypothetical protein
MVESERVITTTKQGTGTYHRLDDGGAACGLLDGCKEWPDSRADYYDGPTGEIEVGEQVAIADRGAAEAVGLEPCDICYDGSGIGMTVREIKAELATVTGLEFEDSASVTKQDAHELLEWARQQTRDE